MKKRNYPAQIGRELFNSAPGCGKQVGVAYIGYSSRPDRRKMGCCWIVTKKQIILGLALVFLFIALPGNRAATANPGESWAQTAAELESGHHWSELLKHAFRWTRQSPGDYRAWFNMGLAQEQLGLGKQAEGSYRQSLRLNPDFAPSWYNLGVVLREKKEWPEAIAANLKALELVPELTPARFNLAVLYGLSGKRDREIALLEQITADDPEFIPAWYNLGAAYAVKGEKDRVSEIHRRLQILAPELAAEFATKHRP